MTIPTVYLDSQDFSRFTEVHLDYAKTLPILNDLRALKAEQRVRSVYSDIHLFESLPSDRNAFKPGLARAKVIAELCGPNSLPSLFDTIEHELRSMVAAASGQAMPAPLHSDWFPHMPLPNPRKLRDAALNEELKTRTNRWERRVAKKVVAKRKTPCMRKAAEDGADRLMDQYPFARLSR